MIVPKGKAVYIGAKRYIEGDALPPHIYLEIAEEKKETVSERADDFLFQKPKKPLMAMKNDRLY